MPDITPVLSNRIELDPRHAARLRQMQAQLREIQARIESYLDAIVTTLADSGYYRLTDDCAALIAVERPVDRE